MYLFGMDCMSACACVYVCERTNMEMIAKVSYVLYVFEIIALSYCYPQTELRTRFGCDSEI